MYQVLFSLVISFTFSGQLGKGHTFHDQAVMACYNVRDCLHEFNLRFDHVLKFTVYLTDISMQNQFLDVFSNFVEALIQRQHL